MKHRVLLSLVLLLCSFVATAQTKKVQTQTKDVDVLGNTCKETSSFYYDDNDKKILHGKYTQKCATNREGYQFNRTESVNFVDGEPDGPYSYSYTLLNKRQVSLKLAGYYNRYKNYLVIDKANESTTGTYIMGKAHGTWKFSYKYYASVGDEVTKDESNSITVRMDHGRPVGVSLPNGNKYTITYHYDSASGKTYNYVTGGNKQYTIKNNLITSHFVRIKTDEISPIDDPDLKAMIDTITNFRYSYFQLLDKGFVIVKTSDNDVLPRNCDLMQKSLLPSSYLSDFYQHMGDYANKMYRQSADLADFEYDVLHRVKLLSVDEGKDLVDRCIDSKEYHLIDNMLSTHRSPYNTYGAFAFSSATIEELRPYIEERMRVVKEEEERRIAEEKRKEEERIAEKKRKEEERIAEEKRKEEERIAEEKRYEEYTKNIEDINIYYNHYGTKLFTNFSKDMNSVPSEGFKINIFYMRVAQTYLDIAYSELNVLGHRRVLPHSYATADDYASADKIVTFYELFYSYCCEASMVDSLDRLAKQIKAESKNAKDVYKAYQPVYSNVKTTTSFNNYAELYKYAQGISAHLKLQRRCLDFIAMRNEMTQHDEAIQDSKAKYIKKLYQAYYEAADKTWGPTATVSKLTPILETQKKVLALVRRSDIKDFDTKMKKAKIATLDEVLSMSE